MKKGSRKQGGKPLTSVEQFFLDDFLKRLGIQMQCEEESIRIQQRRREQWVAAGLKPELFRPESARRFIGRRRKVAA